MKARFIGKDGSCGFRKGEIYDVWSSVLSKKSWIMICTVDNTKFCGYSNLEKIFENWEFK